MSYVDFARFYDRLTENIDYELLAKYYSDLLEKYGGKIGHAKLLDLACGSGNLSVPLKKLGYDVTGGDLSEDMLVMARQKAPEVTWLRLDMTDLAFDGEFDFVVCALDSINHLEDEKSIKAAFNEVYSSLKPGGVFAADMNTVYKHKRILGNNAYTFDYDGLYCGWQNEYQENDPLNRVDMFLDFFAEEEDGRYIRYEDFVTEIALPAENIGKMLTDCGFEICEISEYQTGNNLEQTENAEKFTFAAKKPLTGW